MILVGIPRYRLPSDIIDREVAKIEELGVEFRYNTRFGKDVDLDSLRAEGFELLREADEPLVIREHARKYQYIVTHAMLWRRVA